MNRLTNRTEYLVGGASRGEVKRKAVQLQLAELGFEPESIKWSEAVREFYQWWRRPKLTQQHEVTHLRFSARREGLVPIRRSE